jgi:hypothetical protein
MRGDAWICRPRIFRRAIRQVDHEVKSRASQGPTAQPYGVVDRRRRVVSRSWINNVRGAFNSATTARAVPGRDPLLESHAMKHLCDAMTVAALALIVPAVDSALDAAPPRPTADPLPAAIHERLARLARLARLDATERRAGAQGALNEAGAADARGLDPPPAPPSSASGGLVSGRGRWRNGSSPPDKTDASAPTKTSATAWTQGARRPVGR